MKLKLLFFSIFIALFYTTTHAQTPGLIYKPSSTEFGKSVLDPNGDGFTSSTVNGFINSDFGVESELAMNAIPVFDIEPSNDTSTGSNGGHTDIISSNSQQSCYILKRTVNAVDYIVVRFRIGNASTASKGYSLLIDSDGLFGTALSSTNLGFDREISFESGNNGRIAVYKHELDNQAQLLASFDVNAYSQRSIALSTEDGNADYFYDFFVPLSTLEVFDPVRFTAVSSINSGSAVLGNISDFNGVNDELYKNNSLFIQQLLIDSFPSINYEDLGEDFETSSWVFQTNTPIVDQGLAPTSTTITGSSIEKDATVIDVLQDGELIGSTTVTNNTWSLTGVSNLNSGDLITATALAEGKSVSGQSSPVQVAISQVCFTNAPTNLVRGNQQTITGVWSQNGVDPTGNAIKIQLFEQNVTTNEIFIRPDNSVFVQPDGTWSMSITDAQNVFNNKTYAVKAIQVASGCESGLSNLSAKTNGGSGVLTSAPQITTSNLTTTLAPQTVSVTNTDAQAAFIYLYVNGVQVRSTSNTVAANATVDFSILGLTENAEVTSRAQVPLAEYWLSNNSNSVNVQLEDPEVSSIPSIFRAITAGTEKSISGSSLEPEGTEIRIFNNTVEIATTTVSVFGTWEVTGLTLTTGDQLTATAKASSKLESLQSETVVVISNLPSSPSLTGPISFGVSQILGTGGIPGELTLILVDGQSIGSVNAESNGDWTFSVENTEDVYRNATVSAVNQVNNIRSNPSNTVLVSGVTDFKFSLVNGDPIPSTLNSGESIQVKILAQACSGSTCTTVTEFNSPVNLASSAVLTPQGITSNFTNGELVLDLIIGGSGNIEVLATNPRDPLAFGNFEVSVNPALWIGGTNTDFSTPANWSQNYVPKTGAAILFDSSVQNNCVMANDLVLSSIDFNSEAHEYKFDLNQKALSLRGALINSNQDKSLIVSGAAKLNLLSSLSDFEIYFSENASLDQFSINTSRSTISLKSPLRVTSLVHLKQGRLVTNALLTFGVTPPAEGEILKEAYVLYESGSIDGDVNVEKFYPAKRAFRMLTSPVNGGSIYENWQNAGLNIAGMGTHITGESGSVGSLNPTTGIDYTQTGNPSFFSFNSATGWEAITNTKAVTLQSGVPYRLMIRGDRTIDLTSNEAPPTETTLVSTGALELGSKIQTFPSATSGTTTFTFVANPYQSRIDISELLKNNTNTNSSQFWVWDPMVNTRGSFVLIDQLTGDGTTTPSTSTATKFIEPGQAFFIQSTESSPSLQFSETIKAITTSLNRSQSTSNNLMQALLELKDADDQVIDGIRLRFSPEADNAVETSDISKIGNMDENLASINNTSLLSIQHRALPQENEVIPLFTNNWRNENYSFTAHLNNFEATEVYLIDNYLSTEIILEDGNNYTFSVDPSISESVSTQRFALRFGAESLNTINSEKIDFSLYPNPAKDLVNIKTNLTNGSEVEIKIYTMQGQELISTHFALENGAIQIDVSRLNSGVYNVQLIEEKGSVVQTKFVKH